jgi:hypothetical protein
MLMLNGLRGTEAPELLRLRDLIPEQAPRVTLPIFAWKAIEAQAQASLVHTESGYSPVRVSEHQLTQFLDATLGTQWRIAPVRDSRVWQNRLDLLRREIERGRWVVLRSDIGSGLVDWVEDPEALDGGHWRVNLRGERSGIGEVLRWHLELVYRERSIRSPGASEIVHAVKEAMTPVRRAASIPVPKAPKPQTDDIAPGLGTSANAILAKSPTLQRDLEDLAEQNWIVLYGEPGKGSFVQRSSDMPSRIVLDGIYKENAPGTIQTLAHEVGHAKYMFTVDLTNKAACLDSFLSDEGAATLKNIEVQREVLANGGPDIGIAGDPRNHSAYNRVYDGYLKSGNARTARRDIGSIFGSGEYTSNTRQTYGSYYGDWCENNAGK